MYISTDTRCTAVQQYSSTAVQQYSSTAVQQYSSTAVQQYSSTNTSCTAVQQYSSTSGSSFPTFSWRLASSTNRGGVSVLPLQEESFGMTTALTLWFMAKQVKSKYEVGLTWAFPQGSLSVLGKFWFSLV